MAQARPLNLADQRTGVVRVIEGDVVDRPAGRRQRVAEMPHRRENEGDFFAVVRHIGALLIRFDHQNPVARRVTRHARALKRAVN